MTFYDISMKMLNANLKKYKLYFLCNVLSITLFYNFAALYTNKSFMDRNIVDYFISSNIYAPSLFTAVFLILFVPYSYNAFSKSRKHEYGILMTLGMSETEVLSNMLLENCIVAGISLISSLIMGTAVSFIFYLFIQNVIGIHGFKWCLSPDSYKVTAVLYGITILFTLVIGILKLVKMKITDLIKEKFRAEKKAKPLLCLFTAGAALIIISIIIMAAWRSVSHMWFISLALMSAGLYMSITNAGSSEKYLIKIFPDYIQKHILEVSFLRQHSKSQSSTVTASTLLIGFCIFIAGVCAVTYPNNLHNAIAYSPYDMVYCQIFKMNQVKDSEIENLLNRNHVSVKKVKQANYLRSNAFNLLSVSEVNEKFNCHYQIPEGRFLMIFQYDLNYSRDYAVSSPSIVNFNCNNKIMKLQSAGSDVKILFNKNPTFADRTLILCDADYNKIASGCRDFWSGTIKLYSFDNWKNSQKGIDAVQKYLMQKNNVDKSTQKHYYSASSKIETYTTEKKSAEFMIFLMSFIGILFCGTADVMIHFKIKSESEEEQRMLSGLYRIGVTPKEMLKIIHYKNMYYYMPQAAIGLFAGTFYSYMSNGFYGCELKAAGYSLFFGTILAGLQLIVVRIYSKKELLSFDISI